MKHCLSWRGEALPQLPQLARGSPRTAISVSYGACSKWRSLGGTCLSDVRDPALDGSWGGGGGVRVCHKAAGSRV